MGGATAGPCLRLVPAAEVDRAAVVELINAAFRRYPILQADRISLEGFEEEAGGSGEMLLVEQGAELVGCGMVRPATELYAEDETTPFGQDMGESLYFGLAAVCPGVMGRGIGHKLVAEAERIGRERGYQFVVLTTMREFGLIEYYEPQGYEVAGFEDYEAGHWGMTVPHRVAYMVKAL